MNKMNTESNIRKINKQLQISTKIYRKGLQHNLTVNNEYESLSKSFI